MRPLALITGAAHGIGFEVCRQLARLGYDVILTARDETRGRASAAELGDAVSFIGLDVTSEDSIIAAAEAVASSYGRIDVLVNNAAQAGAWDELPSAASIDSVRMAFEANLFGAWRVTQAFLPLLKNSEHARIVNVSSGSGSHGDAHFGLAVHAGATAYAVSKAALNALTTKLAVELRESRILVNAVCPGLTATSPGMEAMGARPVEDGAAGIVWAATLPDDGPTGGFFRDGKALPW